MKTGQAKDFLQLHRKKGDIEKRSIHLTEEQIRAIEYLAEDQDLTFEDMAMILVQYQVQMIEVQHQVEMQNRARLN